MAGIGEAWQERHGMLRQGEERRGVAGVVRQRGCYMTPLKAKTIGGRHDPVGKIQCDGQATFL